MKIIAFILTLFLFLTCVKNETFQEVPEIQQTFSYLALGDSYTIGQSVPENGRWPVQLVAKLDTLGIEVDSLKIIAQTGWTTANLQNAMDQEVLEDFDMVSLLIGVNNQYQGSDMEVFEKGFVDLLQRAVLIAGGTEKVFIVSIPDYGVTPFGAGNSEQIAEELDAYNTFMQQTCMDQDIHFVDITEISRDLGDGPNALAPDNLHPSAYQYNIWAEEILPMAVEILEEE
ncbi:MAG: SGNH/GDSL hydrolase family protein [Flavobacteriales bacterium]|nr:SGNH/GDSL hydrolase family protein [Flavobacteriales bacterium]